MNFIVCILASIVSHLLVIGFLYFTHPFTNTEPDIFKVDIVVPAEKKKPLDTKALKSAIKKIRPPLIIRKQPLLTGRVKPPGKELLPETMYGTGAGDYEKSYMDSNKSLSPDKEKLASRKEEKSSSPSADQEIVKPDKDGLALASPSYLFDKKTIEKIARKDPSEKIARKDSSANKSLTFDIPELKNRGYRKMLRERIESVWLSQHKDFFEKVRRLGLSYGDLYVNFSIKKDGKLGKVELQRTSGYVEIDEAIYRLLKDAGPFWPLPDDWEQDELEIPGHFIFIYGDPLVM